MYIYIYVLGGYYLSERGELSGSERLFSSIPSSCLVVYQHR